MFDGAAGMPLSGSLLTRGLSQLPFGLSAASLLLRHSVLRAVHNSQYRFRQQWINCINNIVKHMKSVGMTYM